MRLLTGIGIMLLLLSVAASSVQAYELTQLGEAGGWDDINKAPTATVFIDESDYTLDIPSARVGTAVGNAFNAWDNVAAATNLSFDYQIDDGGNYDVFDGPNDSNGPPWFNGFSNTLDSNAQWRYANIAVGGWLPESYFLNLDPVNGSFILAVAWTGKLSGDGSNKPDWHSEIFFNDGWDWTDDLNTALAGTAIDIETVAIHEIGHSIGFDHEDDVPSVMASFYNGPVRELFTDDIAGVTDLYSNTLKGGGEKGGGKGGGNGNGKGPKNLLASFVGPDTYFLSGVTYAGKPLAASSAALGNPEPATWMLGVLAVLGLLVVGCQGQLRRR